MKIIDDLKPFRPVDFGEERKSKLKEENRVHKIARLSSTKIKFQRKKYEDKITAMKTEHKKALEEGSKESYDRGFADGHKKGLNENRKKVDKALIDIEKLTKKIVASEKDFLRQAEKRLVNLAIDIAKKIIGHEIKSDKDIVVHIVKESLKQVADKSKISILVNPDDLENIKTHRRELMETDRDIEELEFTADPRIEPGECFVETKAGSIDGRIDSQIDEIGRKFSQDM